MDRYDVGIIGAGIAGSSLAILLAQAGKKVVLFEKSDYPTHKVCGEFISLESFTFFEQLGLPLEDWNLPIIKDLLLTSQKGEVTTSSLSVGGFGLSRFKLDLELVKLATQCGVTVFLNSKVVNVEKQIISSTQKSVIADLIIGSYGKYSPKFIQKKRLRPKNNFVGVKYHITGDFRENEIALHSFEGGYCGISQIENNQYCLCYLVDSQLLKKCDNKIALLEERFLWKNTALKEIFNSAHFIWEKPLLISNIKFSKNEVSSDNILLVGDAAGSISPLSGNGMSIAARSANLLFELIMKDTSYDELVKNYNIVWNEAFGKKVRFAKILNKIMLNPTSHNLILKFLNIVPLLKHKVVKSMQGENFVRNY